MTYESVISIHTCGQSVLNDYLKAKKCILFVVLLLLLLQIKKKRKINASNLSLAFLCPYSKKNRKQRIFVVVYF